ncbi:Aste57867_17937 [Aphanomyces stellatus]|uniref:Aste57867_17937 protein n=1 Tax=Aphanomyces stellatus TaxID=120398 RepID=A0A485LAG0_9STRA|nr:hypothetical protein As57867_017875 [Aphanomyces stellatus]VFT94678.1 Aste57867_17937 [Aphanomyces stellatus]
MDQFAKSVEQTAKQIEAQANRFGAQAEHFGNRIGAQAERFGHRMEETLREKKGSHVGLKDVVQWVKETFGSNTDLVYEAAKTNDVARLLQVLDAATPDTRPKLLEYKDSRGRTPLMMACSHNFVVVVQVLLSQGAYIDATDMKGNTPLHYASLEGAVDVVQYLTSLPGVSPYIQNTRGLSPLEVARRGTQNSKPGAAQCVQHLEQRTLVFQGYLYESVDNLGSAVFGLNALKSWAKRFVLILRVGSPLFLEMAFFDVVDGQRSPLPASTFMLHVASPVMLLTKSKLFDAKPHAFTVTGARKKGAGIVGALESCEFAAVDEPSYHTWARFLTGPAMANSLADPMLNPMTNHPTPAAYGVPPSTYVHPTPIVMPPVPSPAAPDAPKTLANDFVYAPPVSALAVAASAPPLDNVHVPEAEAESAMPGECVVCFDGPQNAVCVPCGHAAVCMKCADMVQHSTKQCPVCRAEVREVIQLYHV